MAVEVASAGRIASDALGPVAELVTGAGGGLDALPKAVDALTAAQPAIAEAGARLARAAELRAEVPPLSEPRLVALLAKVDKLLPLAQDGVALLQAAPALLGADAPRTYLLLAQNSEELRATGGFISGAGHVTIDHGRLTGLVLKDSYALDNWQQPHPRPPAAITKYMAADLWVLRDANWSPDFPTSADVARGSTRRTRGSRRTARWRSISRRCACSWAQSARCTVPGVAEPITGANALQWMKSAWENPTAAQGADGQPAGDWWSRRKDFMGDLVKAALAKLQAGGDLDAIALARAVYASLDGRHLQAAVDDPALAALLAQRGWDGGLRLPERSDFLGVVDSNVGFNKANSFVREALDYRVEDVQGGLEATLTITYTHGAPAGAETICDRTAGYGPDYGSLSARCYWDYLRVYTVPDAELIESVGLEQRRHRARRGRRDGFHRRLRAQAGRASRW